MLAKLMKRKAYPKDLTDVTVAGAKAAFAWAEHTRSARHSRPGRDSERIDVSGMHPPSHPERWPL